MRASLRAWFCAVTVGVVVVACGSDDDGDADASNAAVTSCRSYCDADEAAGCGLYESAEECYDFECYYTGAPQTCLDAAKAYYDCQAAAADVCDGQACPTEFTTYFDACT